MNQRQNNPTTFDQEDVQNMVRAAQNGDQVAFSNLYDIYMPSVYKRLWHMIPQQDVEDVTQEVFISTLKSLKSFRGNAKFSTWLWTITSRQVANYYRHKSRKLDEVQTNEFPEEILPAPGGPGKQDEEILMKQGIRNLPENYQEVILLRFAEGLRFQEIAEELGKSLDATKSLFRRAIEALRVEIGETGD